ncbi:uncharacterized protein METZ01_LOCUS190758 [marine metagenome]|uniref:Neck protein n=1 Tax=marine metagenome TaxID=408172 RepID=A0A382DIU1_9ZZZZ
MAQPSSRQGLIDYAKRQLGFPVLEINVADEQFSDLLDDAVQVYQERHYDGITRMYLKYKITQDDIDRGQARGGDTTLGITTTTATSTVGLSTTFDLEENSNYIQMPPSVIGVNQIFKIRSDTVYDGLFNIRYQLFLNDLYAFGSVDLLQYSMVQTYLEDISFLLNPDMRYRFNIRQDRLYIDTDFDVLNVNDFFVIDCFRILDPDDFTRVYNDPFLKRYFTALCKKQWGMNLIKFQGVQLPGGIQLNGRQIYDDGVRELDEIRAKMATDYEMPPLDMIG